MKEKIGKILIRIIAIGAIISSMGGLLLVPVKQEFEEAVVYNFWPLYFLYLAIGIGLFFFKEWARTILIYIVAFFVISGMVPIIFGGVPPLSVFIEIIIYIFVIWILTWESIKEQFKRKRRNNEEEK